ncbi:hypothetical protein D3C80_1396430 [compost metagenome]
MRPGLGRPTMGQRLAQRLFITCLRFGLTSQGDFGQQMAKRRSRLRSISVNRRLLDALGSRSRSAIVLLNQLIDFSYRRRRRLWRSWHQRQRLFLVVEMAAELEITVRTCPEPVEQVRYIVCTIHKRLSEALAHKGARSSRVHRGEHQNDIVNNLNAAIVIVERD